MFAVNSLQDPTVFGETTSEEQEVHSITMVHDEPAVVQGELDYQIENVCCDSMFH